MLSASASPGPAAAAAATMTTPTRPTVRTASVPPPLFQSQSLSLPLDDGHPATTTTTTLLSPTASSSFPLPASSPREPKSPPPPAPTPSVLAPPTPIPSYMQTTKSFASRSPQPPPSTPTRANSVSSSVVSSSAGSSSKRPSRSTTRASNRSRSRPRQANSGASASSTYTPAPDTPALPALPPPTSQPQPVPGPAEPTSASSSPSPPQPPTDFPCASCRAHYTSSSPHTSSPAWTTATHHPHKLHRHLLDLQITNDTLAVLNSDLQATVAQQARFIAQLEEHVARLAAKVGKEEAELVAHLHDQDQDQDEVSVADPQTMSWYEPVSEEKIQDHHKLLARMCDRTHRMLYDARRAVNRNRGDMESVSVEDDYDDDGSGSVTSVDFGEGDEDDEVSEIEADVVPKIVMPAAQSVPAAPMAARGRQLSTCSSIASSTAASTAGSSAGQLHSLVKSLAYHIHLLDSTPPPAPSDLLSPTSRRTSSSTVSSSRITSARSPSPLSLTRTPSGFGVLGLGAVLDLAPPSHHAPAGTGATATAAAARKHQLEQCLVIQRCKDTVMQLCSETGVPMGEVREMVVDAQMHVATSMPGSPTTLTSASRLASPAVASRHPSGYYPGRGGPASDGHSVDEDLVDIRSDASSTRSNYSRVSSSRSFASSDGAGGGGARSSSVLGPNASASALGRAAGVGGGMVYPAGLSLEEKYRMHMAYQQATQGSGAGARTGSMPRVVLHDDADEDTAARSILSGSGSGVGGGGPASSSLSSPTLLPDSTSVVSGVSGGRVVRIKHADAASVVSGGSSAPSVSGRSATGTATPSRVASVLSGFMPSSIGTASRVNGSEAAGDASPQGSSAGRPRGPGSMVARAIKVRTWMG